jgi:hypothetical protein
MRQRCLIFILSVSVIASAKDAPRITIQVTDSQSSVREFTRTTRGTAGTSTTSCDTNGTATGFGDVTHVNANTNCQTTTTPGSPPRQYVQQIAQEHVLAIMPNGNHVKLWCQAGFRRCSSLQAGSYEAEVKGNSLWIFAHELISGKERKVKYQAVGSW